MKIPLSTPSREFVKMLSITVELSMVIRVGLLINGRIPLLNSVSMKFLVPLCVSKFVTFMLKSPIRKQMFVIYSLKQVI